MNINIVIIDIILFIIITFEISVLIIFHFKYVKQFDYQDFMEKICLDHKKLCDEFENIFSHYSDTIEFSFLWKSIKSFFVMASTNLALIIILILEFCGDTKKYKPVWEILLLFYCFGMMMIYLNYAFNAKYKVNLPDNEIYVFDDEFNKEIKINLYFMYKRKIYLIVCPLVVITGTIVNIILILIRIMKGKTNTNSNIITPPPQYNQQDVEQENTTVEVDINHE